MYKFHGTQEIIYEYNNLFFLELKIFDPQNVLQRLPVVGKYKVDAIDWFVVIKIGILRKIDV